MRLIRANNLEAWSETLQSEAEAPALVADLVRASCPNITSYSFPSGNASQTHGLDGITKVEFGSTFVPRGETIWEVGTSQDYKQKADKDFAKRTREYSSQERLNLNFVLVTTRIWPRREEWDQAHQDSGWKSVSLIDANVLELWLAEHPAISLAFAKQLCLLPRAGFRTLDQFWDEYSLACTPPLTEAIFTTGREDVCGNLIHELVAGIPGGSAIQTDSAEESRAFIAAVMRNSEERAQDFLRSRTLFVDSLDAARELTSSKGLVLVLSPDTASLAPVLRRSHQVKLAVGRSERAASAVRIERMGLQGFAAGLQTMGIDEEEAFRLAGICGRSVTVFSRLNRSSHNPAPTWAAELDLVPILLCGSWDESNDNDRAVVSELCNKPYEDVQALCQRVSTQPDAPLDHQSGVWSLRSAMDAFMELGRLVTSSNQNSFRQACITVFSETDRELLQSKPDDIPARNSSFIHSSWLRKGLARSLLLFSALHEAADLFGESHQTNHFVASVIDGIPRLAEDAKVIASLKDELPRLAEAAPYPLARALERVLEGEPNGWVPTIFRDRDRDTLWGAWSPHTYILWAMETIAWSPECIHIASSILLRLADNDPGGRTSNRPAASLRAIFLAWSPSTDAPLQTRLAVLKSLCSAKSSPTVFPLLLSLLPKDHDTALGGAKPRLRSFGLPGTRPMLREEIRKAYVFYTDLAFELASGDLERTLLLVKRFAIFDERRRQELMSSLRQIAHSLGDDDRLRAWSQIHDFIIRHEAFPEAQWSMSEAELVSLRELMHQLEPRSVVQKLQWLFDSHVPHVSPIGTDYIGKAEEERKSAIEVIYRAGGIEGVINLVKNAQLPYFVGQAFATVIQNPKILRLAVSQAFGIDDGKFLDFASAVSAVGNFHGGELWRREAIELAQSVSPQKARILFAGWPDDHRTWDVIHELGPEIEEEYWTRKNAFRVESDSDRDRALQMYGAYGRYSAGIRMISYVEQSVTTEVCVALLEGLIAEVNNEHSILLELRHEIPHLFGVLQDRSDVDLSKLASLEYQFLPLFRFDIAPRTLQKVIFQEPETFLQIICDVFRASDEPRKEDSTEEEKSRATVAYEILSSLTGMPGLRDATVDRSELFAWTSEVRRLATERKRKDITDQQVGQLLAHAPASAEDGAWPCEDVRDLIEEMSSDQIERGIFVGRFNMLGVTTRGVFEGGKQERDLAREYRGWASHQSAWPRVRALLERIAQDWDRIAEREDADRELDQTRSAM